MIDVVDLSRSDMLNNLSVLILWSTFKFNASTHACYSGFKLVIVFFSLNNYK